MRSVGEEGGEEEPLAVGPVSFQGRSSLSPGPGGLGPEKEKKFRPPPRRSVTIGTVSTPGRISSLAIDPSEVGCLVVKEPR